MDALAALREDRFASAQDRLVRLHDFRGRVLRQWNAAGNVQRLAFSPDGAVVSAQVWNPQNGQGQVQAWTAGGQPLKVPTGTLFPVSRVVLTEANDKNGPQQSYRERLSASSLAFGKREWRRGGFGLRLSGHGRWAALSSQAPDAQRDPVDMEFWRLNTATGQPGPMLRLKPTTTDPTSGWGLTALSADGRLALLREGVGVVRVRAGELADRQEGAYACWPCQGLQPAGGCGRDLPSPLRPCGLRAGQPLDGVGWQHVDLVTP